jgi:hypothetical protein
MKKLYKITLFSTVFLLAACLGTSVSRADSFTYSPDTLTFTPTSQDSVISYVRIAYNGDTTGPGTHIHARVYDGSSYFGCPTDTVFTRSYFYLRVAYKPQSSAVYGMISISDDSVTRYVVLIGNALPPSPALAAEGPYFPNIPEGHDTCESSYYGLRLINTTSGPDTIRNVTWSHNSDGIFTWDSVSLPYILGAYDTVYWMFCFNAPDNTEEHIDTLLVYYGSGDAHVSRVVSGTATTTDNTLSAVGPYFPENLREGTDTCVKMTLVNTSSVTDTIESVSWAHASDVFSWDSTKVPFTLGAHDTTYLTFCYHAPDNTETYTDTVNVRYNDANGSGWVDQRMVSAAAVVNDNELSAVGPYFPEHQAEGSDTCVSMRLVNNGSGIDTIEAVQWSHTSNGIFTWDSTKVPFTLGAHDTTNLTFCYHAPDNTETYTDTVIVTYNDANGSQWSDQRVVSATAVDTTPPDGELELYSGPYFPQVVDEGHDTCAAMRVINSGSDLDTIVSTYWSHDPDGIFTWDSVSLPLTIGSHDTDSWTFCFNAPNDTNEYIDTFVVVYRDAYSQDRHATRIVEAKATNPYIVTCYTLYATTFATTNIGDTSYIHMYIRNDLSDSATLTGVHISGSGDGAFHVDSANFPTTIAPDSYDSVVLLFVPNRTSTDNDEYSATLTASFTTKDTDECNAATVSLLGYMPQACSDTETFNVDTTGTADVDVTGDSASYYAHRIDVVNNTNGTIVVTAVKFIDTTSHFYIYQTVPGVPDTLAPGAGMAVIIHFYGDTGQVYYDTLALTISNGTTWGGGKMSTLSTPGTMYISVRGVQTAAPASVTGQAVANAPDLLLYPNPSSGIVNMQLDGAENTTFEVFDVLGNVVASHTGEGTWQWDATSAGLASNGTYFIRASSGSVVATKRLVLQR